MIQWKEENISVGNSNNGGFTIENGKLVKYEGEDSEVTIPDSVTSIGYGAFYGCTSLSSIAIPDSVTNIGERAFYGCTSLSSIAIPDSVTNIGSYAFYHCDSLETVIIGDSVTSIESYVFSYCKKLATIIIPDSITSIGDDAFYYCDSLSSITIPDSVTSIGDSAFYRCSSLTSITVNENNPNYCSLDGVLFNKTVTKLVRYPEGKNEKTYVILDGVTSIGDKAFYNCIHLTKIDIPVSVTDMGESAFEKCAKLTFITIPNNVTSIYACLFSDCTSLTSIEIPDSVTNIGNYAFENCSSLESVIIPNNVKSIQGEVFDGCDSLKDIVFKGTEEDWNNINIGESTKDELNDVTIFFLITTRLTNYGKMVLELFDFTNKQYMLKEYTGSDTEVEIPEDVIVIEAEAFSKCEALTTVQIHDQVKDIRDKAFYNCINLSTITIPDSVTNIGNSVFSYCTSLSTINVDENNLSYSSQDGNLYDKEKTSLLQYAIGQQESSFEIPNSVNYIKAYAFASSKLINIVIPNSTIEIGMGAFENCVYLIEITMSDSIKKIGDYATTKCTELKTINFLGGYANRDNLIESLKQGNGNEYLIDANWKCGVLNEAGDWRYVINEDDGTTVVLVSYTGTGTNVDIPTMIDNTYSVEKIEADAFKEAGQDVTHINIYSTINELDYQVFMGTDNLQQISVNEDNENYSTENGVLFNNNKTTLIYCPQNIQIQEYEIPNTVTIIQEGAFYSNKKITKVQLSDKITSIKENVFYNCPNLEVVDLHNVNLIETNAFSLPQGVKGKAWNFINLNSQVEIFQNAFSGRGATIKHVYFGGSQEDFTSYINDTDITSIETQYYNGVKTEAWEVRGNSLKKCSKDVIENGVLIIPENVWGVSVTKIGSCCFLRNEAITEIQLHDGVITIEESAFYACPKLEKITLGNNLLKIEKSAFVLCEKLNKIFLPNTLEFIGEMAFANCSALSEIKISDNIEFIGANAFYNSKIHGTLEETIDEITYKYSDMWKDGLFILEGNTAKYLVDINEECITNNTEINLEKLSLKLIASGCMDINNANHNFLGEISIIRLPFQVERLNAYAINLTTPNETTN